MPSSVKIPQRLVIASRKSVLALWQASYVQQQLQALYPQCAIEILALSTRGDEILDRSLAEIGGKGLFIKELEQALYTGQADIAVHSLKDVPMDVPEGFQIAAILARETPGDVFVSRRYSSLEQLAEAKSAVVGTSSQRRQHVLAQHYPQLTVKSLRGNVQTRLSKLDSGEYDAIILAAAGLIRLGLAERISQMLPLDTFVPAPGQGALAIEILAGNQSLAELMQPLHHPPSALAVTAERAFSRTLGGSCQIPIGAHAAINDQRLQLTGFVANNKTYVQRQAAIAVPVNIGDATLFDATASDVAAAMADATALGERLGQQCARQLAEATGSSSALV